MSQFPVYRFDKHFVENDDRFLHQLSSFYCNIWRFDPNFAEYKQCSNPECGKYYSYNDYHQLEIRQCQICSADLVEAWTEEEVEKTITKLLEMGDDNFFGAVAILPDMTNTIIGFVWGYNRQINTIEDKNVIKAVNNPTGYTPYFNEIASNQNFRQKGVGSALCRQLTQWMQRTSPNLPGYLHTHENSPARRLFEKAGYKFLCYDEKMGDGRIFMYVDQCKNLTPENLR